MGRSKFPGKPSKSINRKRISVLQIVDEKSSAVATATATATATTAPKEKEDETLTALTTTTATTLKNNKHKHHDDDDDDEEGGGGVGGGGGGGGSSATAAAGGSNIDVQTKSSGNSGNGDNGSNDNSSTSGKSVNGSGTNNSNGQKHSICTDNITTTHDDVNSTNPTQIINAKNQSSIIEYNNNSDDDAPIDDDDDNDESEDEFDDYRDQDDDESDEDDDDDEKDRSMSSNSSPIKHKKCNKKFQNLNLLKPEVMLPSSSKLKQQQQQRDLNRLSPTIPLNNPFAITVLSDAESNNEKSQKKTEATSTSTTNTNTNTYNNTNADIIDNRSPNASSSSNDSTNSNSKSANSTNSSATTTNNKPKKSVTFKNILETSDDKSAVKKFYNPNNRIPLVSIMKKECMTRSLAYSRNSECIVRPSRLTEILKNKNNIDKLDSLKFRSSTSSSAPSLSSSSSSNLCSSLSNAVGPFGLSRAFGAPATDNETDKQDNCIKFHMGFEKTEENTEHTGNGNGNHEVERTDAANNKEATLNIEKDTTIDDAECDDEQQMIVDKHFVLPKRTRSSRVVKPNKRLVEDGIICKKSSLSNKPKSMVAASTTTTSTLTPVPTTQQQELLAPKQETNLATTLPLQKNYFCLGDYNDNNGTLDGLKMLTSQKESPNFNEIKPNLSVLTTALNKSSTSATSLVTSNNTAATTSSSSTSAIFGSFGSLKSNFILRQPRLQFDSLNDRSRTPLIAASCSTTMTTSLAKSAFSTTMSNNTNTQLQLTVGTNCSICDSSIQSKVIQQARKYGSLACAVCRKFVSKITKKSIAASAGPTLKDLQLQCKLDGNCCIQPSVKSHSKNFKKIYKERCSACWLKKCLLNLQFSSSQRQRLSATLSSNVLKQSLADNKRLLVSTTAATATAITAETNATGVRDNEQNSASSLKKEPGLISPNTLSSVRLPTTSSATQQQLKWKSTLDKATEGLRLNLKSNPLAENNVTFGSTPLLRPAILEKPLFLKSTTSNGSLSSISSNSSNTQAIEKQPAIDNNPTVLEMPSDADAEKSSIIKSKRKHKDKDRTKDRDKDGQHKISIVTNKSNENIITSNDTESISVPLSTSAGITTNISTDATIAETETETTTTTGLTSTTATILSVTTIASGSDSSKRQRIDLKGPRVKHVCRSASIVLGQPIAMFGEGEGEGDAEDDERSEEIKDNYENYVNDEKNPPTTTEMKSTNNKETKLPTDILIDENDNCSSCKQQEVEPAAAEKQKPTAIEKVTPTTTTTIAKENKSDLYESSKLSKTTTVLTKALKPHLPIKNTKGYNINTSTAATTTTTQISKKYMRNFNYNNESIQQQLRRKDANAAIPTGIKPKSLISIDFWENYDPAEVCQTGFGLIITETVAQRALCFLCGSTGLDPLLFCACCCEPYHQYCVLDEYNLKHSSLDDTIASLLLDTSTAENTINGGNTSQLVQRLNWLCPRCTVCYTCNMSSGSKVKCQKCQKNYHSTCLGTSKRLLGADRPLICVNCLKCKSCSTTKVSKFVGNLPMCTSCFKLRKRGNYCPICQKCYDDNDFDLKMMECGDCKQWVHSKCEGLSDEQYNLLSTLPETIEFICKKCARRNEQSKQRAQEWRHTVMEEFKTGLLTVLKLLSKSRQACALLKLSPRKKFNCTCGNTNSRMQPKALLFSAGEREHLGSDGESQCSEDIYEFNECPTGSQLNLQSDKLKTITTTKCSCNPAGGVQNSTSSVSTTNNATMQQLSLIDIKKKIANDSYTSLAEFNYDMNNVIQLANCDELIISYKEILSEQFPWFQNETKACTDALEEDMFESGSSYGMNGVGGSSLDGRAPDDVDFRGAGDDIDNNNQLIDLPPNVDDIIFTHKSRQDGRICLFCRKTGEGLSNEESRLLYCGHDCWVHINCAMWSAEVFEEIDGSLQNVHSAVSRGRMIKCTVCGNRGASVGCNVKSCGEHYHYPCARNINCAFLTDKSMYCPTHARDALARAATPNVSVETNFEVTRPVYVELDRKRKKLIDPARVQFHIGSLEVKQLGAVFPRFSDSFEAIIPINFLCSRLYWSCKEPWKIVEYTVRTTIQNSFSSLSTLDVGRNFTVDHSNPNSSLVQLGLAQIARWHTSLSRGESLEMDSSNAGDCRNSTTFSKFLPEYLLHNQNSVLIPNTDENTEEEPQTNADLLPPDLKDAIFEDLPHELLDGISMLDIFPKFMNYEELGNVGDCKAEAFLSEQSKDGVSIATTTATTITNSSNQLSDNDDTNNSSFSKQIDLSNSWSSSSTTNSTSVNHVEDAMLSAARNQFKRSLNVDCSKNENLFLKVGNATVSATAAALKRRKLGKTNAEDVFLSLSHHRQRTKKEAFAAAALARRQSQCLDSDILGGQRTKSFTWSAAKRYIETVSILDDVKDSHNIKLMQVDGVDDSITEYRIINADTQLNGTIKCDRCHCSFRSYDSFQRHLGNCEQMSTNESDSERTPNRSPSSAGVTHILTTDGLNNELHNLARNSNLTNNATATSQATSLPFIQAFQQASAAGIPIGGIQTTANIAGIPIANMQGLQATTTPGVQTLQNLQGLQNLQSLQNLQFQNLQPQTIAGTNFFISQAPTASATQNVNTVTGGTDELQFFSNALQSLTANLNGTYTLAPTTGGATGFTVQPQTTSQPQLIAVSNPDGTQQFIQLPTGTAATATVNPQILQATPNGFQTLQTTGTDKKIILPIASKPVNNKINSKSMPPPASKQKTKANNVKPIQSKMATASTTSGATIQTPQITVLNTNNNNTATAQLLNQNLIQQLQAAANSQQQPLLFQTGATQQQPIIMQQPTQNLISFVTTDGSQNSQVQYLSIPTGDFKTQQTPATSYITATPAATNATTNSLLQGATFLQTDASGNLMLTTTPAATTNGHLQMLSATPLNQHAQVIGTLIQPQTLQLNGNVLTTATTGDTQQPVIISSTTNGTTGNGLDMIAAANAAAATTPQVILATQPMYYGLETIVQNTVMSSQQFVSTAMPGVLSQNASFSATTTQVFQASKIEPLVDIPAGYVVLNNVDTTPSISTGGTTTNQQQQPTHSFINATGLLQQTNGSTAQDQQPTSLETIYRLQQQQNQSSNDNGTTYQFATTQPVQQQSTQPQIVTAKIPPVLTQSKQRNNITTKSTNSAATTKVQPQVINKVMPTSIATKQKQQQQPKSIIQQSQQQSTTNVFVRPTTMATIPAVVSTAIDSMSNQHYVVSQAKPATSICSTPTYDTNISQYQTVNQQQQQHQHQNQQQQHQQQQVFTTVQPMTATITLTTPQQSVSTAATKPLTQQQTTNVRKTNMIRPIHKAEVKPKVLKTTVNAAGVSSTNTKQQAENISVTTAAKLKPQESITTNLNQQLHQINNSTIQPAQQYSLITIGQQKHVAEIQQQSQQLNGVSQNITIQQQNQPQTTYVYDQQQQQIVEYQSSSDQLQENIEMAPYQQEETIQNHHSSTNNINNNHNNNNNSNNNRLQFSTSNSVYNSNVPTNIVNPIQFATSSTTNNMHTTTLTSRPTNRVLPMQQKQQQQDHNKSSINNQSHNNVSNNNKRQQHQQTQEQHSVKCFENTNTNLKICYDTEIMKKEQQSSPLDNYIHQQAQSESHLQQQESFQVLHVQQQQRQQQQQQQQQHENGNVPATIEFSVTELKNGDLQLLENQQHTTNANQQLEVVTNDMQRYEEAINVTSHCLLDEKQHQKLLNTAFSMDPEADNFCEDANESMSSNIAQEDGDDMQDDDDDGFSLKMPTDDEDGMDLDHAISESDEPAVKEKISKILDNLTNDDCADSVTTATTVEAGAVVVDMQHIQYMDENICDNDNKTRNDEANNAFIGNDVEDVDVAAAYIAQMSSANAKAATEVAETIVQDTLKSYKKDITPQIVAEVKMPSDANKENDVTTKQSVQSSSTTPSQTTTHTTYAHPPHYPHRDPKKITGPHLLYEIQSEDGFTYKSTSISEIWEKVFEAVQVARRAHGLAPLPEGPLADMSGVQMIGLKTNALKYLIEQLPGVEKCNKYTPKYHKRSVSTPNYINSNNSNSSNGSAVSAAGCDASNSNSALDYGSDQEELHENPYESVRCEPYAQRSEYDMFSWLASRHRKQPIQVFVQPSDSEIIARRGTGSNLPMAMKYRTLKETYKDYVGVFRSHIHGRGLYCTKDIEAGEMVIEYAGELIRSTLTDKRERNYNSRGIGCYMFKIDDNLVVDATMRGNAARFINHSCEPNCYSKVVDILGHKHIIIFALRRIVQGEELTYDYKFPFEDEKIPCSCGSKKCRKYLN